MVAGAGRFLVVSSRLLAGVGLDSVGVATPVSGGVMSVVKAFLMRSFLLLALGLGVDNDCACKDGCCCGVAGAFCDREWDEWFCGASEGAGMSEIGPAKEVRTRAALVAF